MFKSAHRRRGLALVVVLLVLVVVALLAATTAMLGNSTQTLSIEGQSEVALLHAADGGLQELMQAVNANPLYGTASLPTSLNVTVNGGGAYSLAMPGRDLQKTDYWWVFREGTEPYSTNNLGGKTAITRGDGLVVPPDCLLAIVSASERGAVEGSKAEARPVRVAALVSDRWTDGIAADSVINLKNSIVRDAHPGTGAIVRSNQPETLPRGEKYAIQVGDVVGDVICCLNSSLIQPDPPNGAWTNHGFQPPVDLPNIPIDEMVHNAASQATYRFNSAVTASWSGGKLVVAKKHASPEVIEAPTTIYVNGDFTYDGSKVLPTGLRIFVDGDITINGGVSSGPTPSDFSYLFSTGSITVNGASMVHTHLLATDAIQVNGNSNLDGFLYTRQGDINVTGGGNGSITGVMIARDPDRTDANILGQVDTSNYQVTTQLDYLAEFRDQFPETHFRRLYVLTWWRLQ